MFRDKHEFPYFLINCLIKSFSVGSFFKKLYQDKVPKPTGLNDNVKLKKHVKERNQTTSSTHVVKVIPMPVPKRKLDSNEETNFEKITAARKLQKQPAVS